MEKIEVIHCQTKKDIEALREDWSITWEGLTTDEESLDQVLAWIGHYTDVINRKIYVTSGKLMNSAYGLTGTNAYPDDLSIVSVMSKDIENLSALSVPRFAVGGRWMYDVVENNLRREREKMTA